MNSKRNLGRTIYLTLLLTLSTTIVVRRLFLPAVPTQLAGELVWATVLANSLLALFYLNRPDAPDATTKRDKS